VFGVNEELSRVEWVSSVGHFAADPQSPSLNKRFRNKSRNIWLFCLQSFAAHMDRLAEGCAGAVYFVRLLSRISSAVNSRPQTLQPTKRGKCCDPWHVQSFGTPGPYQLATTLRTLSLNHSRTPRTFLVNSKNQWPLSWIE